MCTYLCNHHNPALFLCKMVINVWASPSLMFPSFKRSPVTCVIEVAFAHGKTQAQVTPVAQAQKPPGVPSEVAVESS